MESKANKYHDFSAISYKSSVAERFRLFSKKVCRNHSETLTVMMDFFENNSISPHEDPGPKMQTLESLIKKRINAVIAIMKDIEKNKANPTLAILESLMEAADPKNKNWNQKKRDYEEDDTHPDFYK